MSTNPALIFVYLWLAVFLVYVGWLFVKAYGRSDRRR